MSRFDRLDEASALLNSKGVRLMVDTPAGVPTVGLWSWTDSPEIRAALSRLGLSEQPWRYLDGPGIPDRYKGCNIPGGENPVPVSVLYQMYASTTPWTVRDEWIREHHWFNAPVTTTLPPAAWEAFKRKEQNE